MIQTLFIACLSALAGAYLFYWVARLFLRLKLKKRFGRASLGEKEAEEILLEKGYKIEERQTSSKLSMWVNGLEHSYLVRPDAFAIKENKRYLVEVKTGKLATNPKHAPTRRQLLEYFHGFDVEGVLLVDADQKAIHQVHFTPLKMEVAQESFVESPLPSPKKFKVFLAFSIGLIFAFLLGALWR
ncbi:MAG: hypothetical protein S4CHLAM7_11810 [Chlamydiae bacterium]|nr:hypothetical protein [Chlamydiota bacterium]